MLLHRLIPDLSAISWNDDVRIGKMDYPILNHPKVGTLIAKARGLRAKITKDSTLSGFYTELKEDLIKVIEAECTIMQSRKHNELYFMFYACPVSLGTTIDFTNYEVTETFVFKYAANSC